MSNAPTPTPSLSRDTRLARTRTFGIVTIAIWHVVQFSGPADGWYVVTVEADGRQGAQFEQLDSITEARQFANDVWRIYKDHAPEVLDPQDAVSRVSYGYQEHDRVCECEIDWKCPLCQEIGRYHSILDR